MGLLYLLLNVLSLQCTMPFASSVSVHIIAQKITGIVHVKLQSLHKKITDTVHVNLQ